MSVKKILIGFALMFLFLFACESQPRKTETFSNIYKEDLSKVDKIKIQSGRTGELRTITDQEQIQQWLNSVKDLQFIPKSNQEDQKGWLYWVILYKGDNKEFEFFNNRIDDIYYDSNEQLNTSLEKLFNDAR